MSTVPSSPISIGSHVGHYTITRALGAGGMGEVFEAEDTRLHRRVALKLVRRDLATDPIRRARLEREAAAAAKLNHPRIVTLHSLDEHGGHVFLTMELVEGTTLSASIPSEGLPNERFMRLAIQLADGLGAAHASGVVHRDLKPTNVMLGREDSIKILDFGLSKLAVHAAAGGLISETLTADAALVGTAPYIAPEQIEGKPADARSDIFSLGIVLFEMATGRRPFAGPTPLSTLSAISKDAAPLASTVNPAVPEVVARVIDRCLEKDPERRTQSAIDVRNQLEDLSELTQSGALLDSRRAVQPRSVQRILMRPNAALAAVALAIAAVLALTGALRIGSGAETAAAADRRVTRFAVPMPKNQVLLAGFNPDVALSPDGRHLAVAPLGGPVWIRALDGVDLRPLEATAADGYRTSPMFSPDGATVSFLEGNAIIASKRLFQKGALSGGAAVKLAEYDMFHRGDWTEDGWIYWTAQYPGGIVRMRDAGGAIERVTELDVTGGERSHRFAAVLPGANSLMYTAAFDGIQSYDDARVDLWDFTTKTRRNLIARGTSAVYSPSGHIVYARAGSLYAVPFDVSRSQVTGTPFEVLKGVLMSGNTGAAQFSISRRGDLAYVPGKAEGANRTLVWVDRTGKAETLPLPPAAYLYPRLSPDRRYLAVEIEGPNHDFYLYDFARSVLTKMTTDGQSHDPVWSPDGKLLAFRSWQAGGMTLWLMPADRSAAPVRLDPNGTRQSPSSFSPDGRFLSFDAKDPNTEDDAWVLPLAGGKPQPVAATRFGEGSPKFSPDGRWIAYASDESGKAEVYVQSFPGPGPKIQVSRDGGVDPVWRPAGGELYYRAEGKTMAVSIATTPTLRASAPRELWRGDYSYGAASSCGMPGVSSSNYDVTHDGSRFLMVRDEDSEVYGDRVIVVLNWAEELRKSVVRSP